jgi:hypothetical protein
MEVRITFTLLFSPRVETLDVFSARHPVILRDEGLWSLDISKDGFPAAAQSVAKELGGRRRGSRWQTAALT